MSAYLFQNLYQFYWWECSSHNKVRELGSKRCKSVWSISLTSHEFPTKCEFSAIIHCPVRKDQQIFVPASFYNWVVSRMNISDSENAFSSNFSSNCLISNSHSFLALLLPLACLLVLHFVMYTSGFHDFHHFSRNSPIFWIFTIF